MNAVFCAQIPISIGELCDKYSILLIKSECIVDERKLKYIHTELAYLTVLIKEFNIDDAVILEIKVCNKSLWDIEDAIREKENKGLFDNEFIELARAVYKTNDKRCEIKNKINTLYNSELFEIKSY